MVGRNLKRLNVYKKLLIMLDVYYFVINEKKLKWDNLNR